jgi:tripartite-type tricarboxylate transporter receptor subunit TctC
VHTLSDGYTLLMVGPSNAVNATLYDKLSFVFLRDIAPVASILSYPQVVVVHPSVPVKTIPQLIAYAKANPGRLNMVSSGIGAADHLIGELFKTMAGVDMIHVPYRGIAPAMTDLIAGQAHICFPGTVSSIEHIRNGMLRALAVTTATRSEVLTRPAASKRFPSWLRGERVAWCRSSKGHASGDHRKAE